MVEVHLKHISRIYDAQKPPAVNRVNITVRDGEFLTLVGPSGSGKSTCLRMLAGLDPVEEGAVLIDGEDVTQKRPSQRDVAMVFQSYALYPNMTVRQNMAFALENAKMPKGQVAQKVEQAAKMLELEGLLDRKPAELSGGQRQRVSMGRAIVREPKVFLMDEPLSNLDARLRVSTRAQIAALQRELGVTTVYVTHDQTEAMTMGDRVAVLKDGELQQCDEPLHLYHHPGNTFVAAFIGSPSMTLVDGVPVQGETARLGGLSLPIPSELAAKASDQVVVGVRPEDWRAAPASGSAEGVLGTVVHVEQLGAESFVSVVPEEGAGLTVRGGQAVVRLGPEQEHVVGDRVALLPGRAHFFDPETGTSLEYL